MLILFHYIILTVSILILSGIVLFALSQYFAFNLPTLLLPLWLIECIFILTAFRDYKEFYPLNLYLLIITAAALPLFRYIYEKKGLGPGSMLTRRVDKGVLLTFDDGPSEYTEPILDILEKESASAVFFVVGKEVEQYQEVMKKLDSSSSVTGVHSFNHRPLPFLFTSSMKSEIEKTVKVIEEVTGKRPEFFRPPWGLYNRQVLETAGSMGLKTILWSRSSRDWTGISPQRITENSLKDLETGEILLFHDGHKEGASRKPTVDALKKFFKPLTGQGQSVFSAKTLEISEKLC